MTEPSHEYPVTIHWISESEGVLESPDGLPSLPVAPPPQFGGPPGVWTPEHLLVSAVASCLLTTFLAYAKHAHVAVLSFEAPARGRLERTEDRRYRFASVELWPRVTVGSEADAERAKGLMARAEAACLISRSLACPVLVEPQIEVATAVPAGG